MPVLFSLCMSQHHMTVTSLSGATVKLVAGFDPRLQVFFLSLRDVRVNALDEEQDEENPDFTLLNYDSLGDAQAMRSIGDVEGVLEEYAVLFGARAGLAQIENAATRTGFSTNSIRNVAYTRNRARQVASRPS